MKKEALKKLGILGVSFGLVASPLAFAMEEHEEQPATPQEETMQDEQGTFKETLHKSRRSCRIDTGGVESDHPATV